MDLYFPWRNDKMPIVNSNFIYSSVIRISEILVFWFFLVFLFWSFSSASRIFTHLETSPLPSEDRKFTPMLGTYWPLSSECPRLLWHGGSVYNGHLRGPVTLTPCAERLAVELSLPVFGLSWLRFEHPLFRLLAGRTLLPTAPPPRRSTGKKRKCAVKRNACRWNVICHFKEF